MKAYKSLASFCLLLIAIRRGSSAFAPLDEKTQCASSTLIQFNKYFECVCDKDKVHKDEKTCAESIKGQCTKADEVCGNFAVCESDGQSPPKIECTCVDGYELDASSPPVCVPRGCKTIGDTCKNGLCVKKTDTEAQCACHLGFKLDSSGKCTEKNDADDKCKLTCKGENVACVIDEASKHYHCGCLEGFELKEGKCVKVEHKEEYIPLTEKSTCKNSTLIEYVDYFVCACDEGLVHEDIDKCEKSTDGKCNKAGEVCGDFAVCTVDSSSKDQALQCTCKNGYKLNNDKKPVCVPIGCESAAPNACGNGFCAKKSDKVPQCTCFLGHEYDYKQGKCVESKKENKCKLTCTGDNVECMITDNEYFKCDCKTGYKMENGTCVEAPKGGAFPGSGILNVGLLFLASSIVYILV